MAKRAGDEQVSDPTTLVWTIPMPPTKNHGAGSWRAIKRAKDAYWRLLDVFWIRAQQRGEIVAPAACWPALLASAVCYPRGVNDEGNLMARMKPLEDWIVARGIVRDDSPKHWHWLGVPAQRPQRKHPAWMTLTLRRCDVVHAPHPRPEAA